MGQAPPLGSPAGGCRLSARALFVAAAGAVLLVAVLLLVIRPALERGGAGELGLVGAIVVAVLLFERWLRRR